MEGFFMKLEPESRKQLLRIAGGTAICTAAMWVLFAALHLVGWVRFDYTVVLASLVGAAVAIGNFAGICFVVQKIIDEPDEKKRKATLQLSYNSRMLLQAVWVVVAIAAACRLDTFSSLRPCPSQMARPESSAITIQVLTRVWVILKSPSSGMLVWMVYRIFAPFSSIC